MKKKPKPKFDAETQETLRMLYREIGEVRGWITGFHAGKGTAFPGIPGEDSLRLTQILLKEMLGE